jgi:hypothetical protein
VVYGDGLENHCTEMYRRFKSSPFRHMERWQSGLLHFPAKEEWRYTSTVGSNPALSAKYDSIAQVDRAMVS